MQLLNCAWTLFVYSGIGHRLSGFVLNLFCWILVQRLYLVWKSNVGQIFVLLALVNLKDSTGILRYSSNLKVEYDLRSSMNFEMNWIVPGQSVSKCCLDSTYHIYCDNNFFVAMILFSRKPQPSSRWFQSLKTTPRDCWHPWSTQWRWFENGGAHYCRIDETSSKFSRNWEQNQILGRSEKENTAKTEFTSMCNEITLLISARIRLSSYFF